MTNVPTDCPLQRLDFVEIGSALVNAFVVSRMMGHTQPSNTLRDYVHLPPGQADAPAFVFDVLVRPSEVVERWMSDEYVARWGQILVELTYG